MQDTLLFYYLVGVTYSVISFLDKELYLDLANLTPLELVLLPCLLLVTPTMLPLLIYWDWKQN